MLTNIATMWPPAPSPEQPQTGTKTKHENTTDSIIVESLADLHEPAWWSGVRVAVHNHENGVQVRLLKGDGTPVFDSEPDTCDWFQNTDTWVKFPWPIPAAMARTLDIKLEVTVLEPAAGAEPFVALTTCFHEMPHMPTRDHYLFVNGDGRPVHVWNGVKRLDGTPHLRVEPEWRKIHWVVPPSAYLFSWETKAFCIHAWTEHVMV